LGEIPWGQTLWGKVSALSHRTQFENQYKNKAYLSSQRFLWRLFEVVLFCCLILPSRSKMGVIQNLKLWKNNVTHIDAHGNEVTEEVPRVMPPPPWKVIALLDLKAWLYFCLGL
jgi:hypothetical protein